VLWQILVCSIWHRTGLLTELLDALAEQMLPGVGVIVFRDNLQTGYGEKCQALVEASTAEYVSFIDDDDMVDFEFVPWIVAALEREPDYVGFNVRFTEDGVLQMPVIHSLEYPGWHNTAERLYRDIVHFNPIRRELALRSRWYGGNGADRQWAEELRSQCCVHTQEYIPLDLLHYQHVMADTFEAPRVPLAVEPPLPQYPFVTHL
jgi:hypothetical protein